jgi:pSer/pThr/pTyr-binding forkhead associated (FHA) protein
MNTMDVTLNVLKGAKSGGKIALKKETFLIGRSRKCDLCAGTDSISRQHCVITRRDTHVSIEDLGSRNGTFVNGKHIDKPVQLNSGDELAIGPLRFLVTISHGISNLKRTKVKSIADVAQRTANAHNADVLEDDITSWLSGPSPASSMTDTQTIRLDDTNATEMKKAMEELIRQNTKMKKTDAQSNTAQTPADSHDKNTETSESTSGRQKEPGKLPRISTKPASKDSREAAAEALRSWGRRS